MGTLKYTTRPAVLADAQFLRGKLRVADYAEVKAVAGENADDSLMRCFDVSRAVWVGCVHEQPILIFGVASYSRMNFVGSPWLLGTDEVEKIGIAVVRRSRHYVRQMLQFYPMLENYTDDRHTAAHKWLRWCGFELEEPAPFGVEGIPFRRFHLEM